MRRQGTLAGARALEKGIQMADQDPKKKIFLRLPYVLTEDGDGGKIIFQQTIILFAWSDFKDTKVFVMTFCKTDIGEKIGALKKRIMKNSAKAAAAGLVPIPGADIALNMAIIVDEVRHYQQVLNLDDAALFHALLPLERADGFSNASIEIYLTTFLKTIPASAILAADDAIKSIPVAGQIVGPVAGFVCNSCGTYYILTKILKLIEAYLENNIEQNKNCDI